MAETIDDDGAPVPQGRRARKALATRHAMFEAGLDAFQNRPIGMVSVLDITEATDVAKGVFYLHFRGKDDFLLALWEHVQRTFLDAVRLALASARSRKARVHAVAGHYLQMLEESERECRFWLRMSSYFGDEIGQPGQLSRLRQEYLQQLAALTAGTTMYEVDAIEVRVATAIDGTAWGLISQALQIGADPVGDLDFVALVEGAARSVR